MMCSTVGICNIGVGVLGISTGGGISAKSMEGTSDEKMSDDDSSSAEMDQEVFFIQQSKGLRDGKGGKKDGKKDGKKGNNGGKKEEKKDGKQGGMENRVGTVMENRVGTVVQRGE
jgi:hypothetical protein